MRLRSVASLGVVWLVAFCASELDYAVAAISFRPVVSGVVVAAAGDATIRTIRDYMSAPR